MIGHPSFSVAPWSLRETELNLDLLAESESLFALSNGHIGWRGNLDEGEPHGIPGSYLGGVYESRPLPYAEAGYGYPESGQTVINVTNGKLIRLLIDDEPFDIRYGRLHSHERELDFRAGVLTRRVTWESPAHQVVKVSSTRLVSFTHRSVAAVRYEIEPVDSPVRVVLQSELVANEQLPMSGGDPRVAAVLEAPLIAEEDSVRGNGAVLVHATRRSGLRVAAAMSHSVETPRDANVSAESFPDLARTSVTTDLRPGQRLRVDKFVAYGWSRRRSRPAVVDQTVAALTGAERVGWDGLLDDQRTYLDAYWDRADVELEGDAEVQQAVRFGMFHVLQSGARAEQRAIPSKGLTGPGYDGHCFWDTEAYVLPVLTLTASHATADALRWRHSTLPMAIERATQLGLRGAAFPWRTIHGEECSGYWPAGTAAFHINADIASAVIHYLEATHDEEFAQGVGLDLLVHTARLWRSLGHHDRDGAFRIDGVTGPDEYSAVADNNVYTNLMAQQNLRAAAELVRRYPGPAHRLDADMEEAASWWDAAESMFIPYDETLRVHPQAEMFTGHQPWNFAETRPDQYPLMLHFAYFDLYRKQVVKQADLVMAMLVRGDAFTDEEKVRNFDYYERLTVRDSSLSACVQSAVAAEVRQLSLAYDYLAEASLIDLENLQSNTGDGVHIASLAGSWIAIVYGLGGLRLRDGTYGFAPRLPEGLTRLAFTVCVRGRHLRVETNGVEARYSLKSGEPLEIEHYGTRVTVPARGSLTRRIPELPKAPRSAQVPGREPLARCTTTQPRRVDRLSPVSSSRGRRASRGGGAGRTGGTHHS